MAAVDNYATLASGLDSPAQHAATVTPSDTVDVGTDVARALYVGVTGDVTLDTVTETAVLFKAVPVGLLPVRAKRVRASGTTATNIVALW